MESLNLLDAFIRSAQLGSFSAAARSLGLTPAAVSKNVARLEEDLGLRLFHRSTRKLALTGEGEQFLENAAGPYASLQDAFAHAAQREGKPSGVLRLSVGLGFGNEYIVPLLGDFLARYPGIVPDWHFENRAVDLVGEGYDAAIAGGIELTEGVIARKLAPIYAIVVASPAYMAGRPVPRHPADLANLEGIVRRSGPTGRLRARTLRNAAGQEAPAEAGIRMIFDDPEAMAHAAMLGYGVAILPTPHAARWIASGALVRLLPEWYADLGQLSIYYPNKRLVPLKTRAFIDFAVEAFRRKRLAALFDPR
ncbi:LysR family transcriptional regulator [Achromobacter aloeverae]|uniref:LysR family transcriptional regulator n=1 Tax=Achromobacter aloeverae TaxID=1750518 RepID=A0A4Q1HN33_9BURK|nr:LysR family transcriptional regulator [Achromobacter aloeverae]RXN92299.1 LysR family transcriptional regulator [Achromobacter aloeverae]